MTKVTLTVAVGLDGGTILDDAINLSVCLGWLNDDQPSEWWGVLRSVCMHAQGHEVRVMSMQVLQTFMLSAMTMGEVERPPQDTENAVNLTGARRAKAALAVHLHDPATLAPVPQPLPGQVVAIVGMTGPEALAAMNLSRPPVQF